MLKTEKRKMKSISNVIFLSTNEFKKLSVDLQLQLFLLVSSINYHSLEIGIAHKTVVYYIVEINFSFVAIFIP